MKKKLLLDLDGLLVDWHAGVFKVHNLNIPRKDLTWDFWKALNISDDDFYRPMGYAFWRDLPWTSEGPRLLKLLENIVGKDRIYISTSPADVIGCMDGKKAWIKANMPDYKYRFSIGPAKEIAASANTCLIDDRDKNCMNFKNEGGFTVLAPRPWNILRSLTDDQGGFKVKYVVDQVKKWLET